MNNQSINQVTQIDPNHETKLYIDVQVFNQYSLISYQYKKTSTTRRTVGLSEREKFEYLIGR